MTIVADDRRLPHGRRSTIASWPTIDDCLMADDRRSACRRRLTIGLSPTID